MTHGNRMMPLLLFLG
ncbi:hypothetical protein FMK49_27390 [Klebsiella michiganensis]|nr:hypothetical protein [Klebsiella michiganensis]MBZ7489145.1 hypothetical protein [Klebsiella michiganensis]